MIDLTYSEDQIICVNNFDDFINIFFYGNINVICFNRELKGDFSEIVSKIELGKGIPSISFNLKHGGAALINRKDPKQALTELKEFGQRIHDNNWSATIFPEGTRSVTGKPKKFYYNGLKMMIKYNPEAYIVPITINNSWKVFKYGKFPLGMFNKIQFYI